MQEGLEYDTDDLETEVATNNEWHNAFDDVPDDCQKYELLFPDDESIPKWDELKDLLKEYPKLEEEPDYDPEMYKSSASGGEPDNIREIFSDL